MKVAIGPSSFATADITPLQILREKGYQVIENPYHRKLTEEEIIHHLHDVTGLIAGLEILNEKVFNSCPKLKVIARVGIGMDNIDLKAAKKKGIHVSNTPEAPTAAVTEMVIAALLTICRGLVQANAEMHEEKWNKFIGISINSLRILVIGNGRIGKKVKEILSQLGSDVKTYDPNVDSDFSSLEKALSWAEVISLHASGNNEIIGTNEINKMNDGVILLNSARGNLINEEALYNALKCKKIKACWMDVFPTEPYSGKLTKCKNVLMTPHISTYTKQCRLLMEKQAVMNLIRDLAYV